MAKGTATCICQTCGKEFTVTTIQRNRSEADRWASWAAAHYCECDECRAARRQREREEQNAAAMAESSAAGWPELQGSEKQAAWAATLRKKVIDEMQPFIDNATEEGKVILSKGRDWYITTKLDASWWIDNRYSGAIRLLKDYVAAYQDGSIKEETPEEADIRKAAEEEIIVAPADRQHPGYVEFAVTDKQVSVTYQRNEDFRKVVKGLGYTWEADSGRWTLDVTLRKGPAKERAAELGNKLLNAGFAIMIADADTRQAAIDGTYEPEKTRWVTMLQKEGCFVIRWGGDEDLYHKARNLPGAKYVKSTIRVPLKYWEQIVDFAEIHDFQVSDAARAAIQEAKQAEIIVTPAAAKNAEYQEKDIGAILTEDATVIEDLKDEP